MDEKNNSLIIYLSAILFTVLVPVSSSASLIAPPRDDYNVTNHYLPKAIKLGVGTSAYQIEGAWNQSGKSPSYMDNYYVKYNDYVADGATAEITCDSYNKYLEDLELIKDIKADIYRFTIPWTRILPTGFTNYINWEAVDHYNNLIDGLLAAGIEPYVNIMHFDAPLIFSDLGGWNQPKLVDYFTDYADLLFSLFGDRVRNWMTVNEPLTFCIAFPNFYLKGIEPFFAYGYTEYMCSHNVIKAHAKVYRLYERKYKKIQGGRISINIPSTMSKTNGSIEDPELLERANDFFMGLYLHPLIHGDYPKVLKETIAKKSRNQGLKESRLPKFTKEEIKEIKGTLDFLAVNFYGPFVLNGTGNISNPSFLSDLGIDSFTLDYSGIQVDAFRSTLRYLRDNYNNPEIVITEIGKPNVASLEDTERTAFIQVMLSEVLKATEEDDINLTGFIVWSLMDNIEFLDGFTNPYGLYRVNFTDPNRTRTPRMSAGFFRNVSETRCLLEICV